MTTATAMPTPAYNDRVHTAEGWVESLRLLVGLLSPALPVPLRLRTVDEVRLVLTCNYEGVHVLYFEDDEGEATHIEGQARITDDAHLIMGDVDGRGSWDFGAIYSAHLNARSTTL